MDQVSLAVYGDSWADCSNGHTDPSLDFQGWPYLLQGYVVKNYARAATSLYYSYKLFKQSQDKYDRVVFVVTVPGRWHKTVELSTRPVEMNSPYAVQRNRNFCASALDRAIVQAFEGYFAHIMDIGVDRDFNALMIDDIVRTRPDAILIPIVDNLIKGVPLVRYVESFVRSTRPEYLAEFKSRGWFGPELTTERNMICHMTPEVNARVAEAVVLALAQGRWDPQVPEFIPHSHPFDYYIGSD